jgi:hypothetical protein
MENEYGEESEELAVVETSAVCAGSLIVKEKQMYTGQVTRVSERLGMFDVKNLDMDAPVFENLAAWVDAQEGIPFVMVDGERLEFEHCGVVGPDCEDPPGYGVSGGIAYNTEEPSCDPTEACIECGNLMCTACRVDDTLCYYCTEKVDSDDE